MDYKVKFLPIGYFLEATSTVRPPALRAAAYFETHHKGGSIARRRPDMALSAPLHQITASTLLIVRGNGCSRNGMNKMAFTITVKEMKIIHGATHL
jgi:hypothetical protein